MNDARFFCVISASSPSKQVANLDNLFARNKKDTEVVDCGMHAKVQLWHKTESDENVLSKLFCYFYIVLQKGVDQVTD